MLIMFFLSLMLRTIYICFIRWYNNTSIGIISIIPAFKMHGRAFVRMFSNEKTFCNSVLAIICHLSSWASYLMTRGNHRVVKHRSAIYPPRKTKVCYQSGCIALRITFTLFSVANLPYSLQLTRLREEVIRTRLGTSYEIVVFKR